MNSLRGTKSVSKLKGANLKRLYTLWNSRRREDRNPARSDFDPTDMPWVLSVLIIVDIERSPLRFRYRLVGTELCNVILKTELTGRYVDELPDPELIDFVLPYYRRVAETGEPLAIDVSEHVGQHFLAFECVFLPLSSDGMVVDKMFIAFDFNQAPATGRHQQE